MTNQPKRILFPAVHQVMIHPEPDNRGSYLHSVFVGLTAPIINLPMMVINAILMPVFFGILFVLRFALICVFNGLLGRVTGVDVPESTISVIYSYGEDDAEAIDSDASGDKS